MQLSVLYRPILNLFLHVHLRKSICSSNARFFGFPIHWWRWSLRHGRPAVSLWLWSPDSQFTSCDSVTIVPNRIITCFPCLLACTALRIILSIPTSVWDSANRRRYCGGTSLVLVGGIANPLHCPIYLTRGLRRSHTLRSSYHHIANSCSLSVNGDIAIQWEWSNFDHS